METNAVVGFLFQSLTLSDTFTIELADVSSVEDFSRSPDRSTSVHVTIGLQS